LNDRTPIDQFGPYDFNEQLMPLDDSFASSALDLISMSL
jgi:hypothetical protein